MKISEIITDKYKLRLPPTVYYDLLADVAEAEEEQESILDKIFPDNATNGDMIKTIFPNLEWTDERGDTKSYILEPEHILSPKLIAFNSWWDAPYKAESEVEE